MDRISKSGMKNKIMLVIATIGFICWLIFISTKNFALIPIIGIGFGLSYGTALGYWIFKNDN